MPTRPWSKQRKRGGGEGLVRRMATLIENLGAYEYCSVVPLERARYMPGLEPGPRSRDGVVANDQDHPPGMFGSSRLLYTFLKHLKIPSGLFQTVSLTY